MDMFPRIVIPTLLLFVLFIGEGHNGCPELQCGNGPRIRFPFRLKDTQPDQHCGYPGFDLYCSHNNVTVLKLASSVKSFVNSIDYESQFINVTVSDNCFPRKIPGLHLSSPPFQFKNSLSNYSLFNCTPDTDTYLIPYLIPCLSSCRHPVYAIPSDKDINDLPILSCTKMYSVSSVPYDIWDSSLELTWSEPAKCGRCERKGKKCRFQNNSTDLKTECFPNKAVERPSLSKFFRDRVHRARLHVDRDFHSLVSLRRLAKWGLGPNLSDEAIAHEVTVRRRMATMKGNKGKDVATEGNRPEGDVQTRPTTGEKRKTLSRNLDLGNLPSRRGKKAMPSLTQVIKPPSSQQPVQVVDVDSSTPVETTPSQATPSRTVSTPSQPPKTAPSNIIENEDLAWECFKKAVTDEGINACYDMSLKDFEHSGVHDLFKGMLKFIVASRQATGLDKTKILLETRVQELKVKARQWAEVATKTTDEVKELQTLVEELRTSAAEKDVRLEALQKKNDEYGALLSNVKEDAVAEFKSSKQYTEVLDTNYAAGFEDFRSEAVERFPDIDFSSILLNLNAAATSSLVQTGFDDINVEDDATTLPLQDAPNVSPST